MAQGVTLPEPSTPEAQPRAKAQPLPRVVGGALRRLRGRIRRYVMLEGAASVLAWLALGFWLTLAIDWLFEPSVAVRVLLLAAAVAAVAVVAYRTFLRRAFVPLPQKSMALLLERRFDRFGDALLTSVELADDDAHTDLFNQELLDRTREKAERQVADVPSPRSV